VDFVEHTAKDGADLQDEEEDQDVEVETHEKSHDQDASGLGLPDFSCISVACNSIMWNHVGLPVCEL
jgi:hypothetical protein